MSYHGSTILGMGFTFDDTDKRGVAAPLATMHQLIANDQRNREVIFPYIGGREVNTSPTHTHHRYVINFKNIPLRRSNTVAQETIGLPNDDTALCVDERLHSVSWMAATDEERRAWLRDGRVPTDYPGPVAADWPELLAQVEATVKRERDTLKREQYRARWWQHGEKQQALYDAISGLERVLVNCHVSPSLQFVFLPSGMVYSYSLNVYPFQSYAAFSVLQSGLHEIWARFFGSSMRDDLRYTPTDCFETFPFPDRWDVLEALETTGREYYDYRASRAVAKNEGLTRLANRFNDPNENRSADPKTPRTARSDGPSCARRIRLEPPSDAMRFHSGRRCYGCSQSRAALAVWLAGRDSGRAAREALGVE